MTHDNGNDQEIPQGTREDLKKVGLSSFGLVPFSTASAGIPSLQ